MSIWTLLYSGSTILLHRSEVWGSEDFNDCTHLHCLTCCVTPVTWWFWSHYAKTHSPWHVSGAVGGRNVTVWRCGCQIMHWSCPTRRDRRPWQSVWLCFKMTHRPNLKLLVHAYPLHAWLHCVLSLHWIGRLSRWNWSDQEITYLSNVTTVNI